MRALILGSVLLSLTACGSNTILLRSEVDPGHLVVVGIEGRSVVIQNHGPRAVEIRRRAPTSEVVGTSTLEPGKTYRTAAESRGAVEIVNTSGAVVGYTIEAVATDDGAARVVILEDREL